MSVCPINHQQGRKVDTATVKALLSVSLRHVNAESYFFCSDPTCDVVYYSQDGLQTFSRDQIREQVYQKEPNLLDVQICYCFGHTRQEVIQAVTNQQAEAIVENIEAGILANQCACDWRNPQGNCCLGNIKKLIKLTKQDEQTSHA